MPFRLAETPLFVPHELRDFLESATRDVIAQLSHPDTIARMRAAIPPRYDCPGMDALPSCAQVDFAVVRGSSGAFEGRVIELQGFPSLYAFLPIQFAAWASVLRTMPGLDLPYSMWLGGHDETSALDVLRRTLLAGLEPSDVVLVDIDPSHQKTLCDFIATHKLFGIDTVCITEIVREGRRLFRRKDGRLVPIRRIYFRTVFDELERKEIQTPFSFRDDLDVTFCPHPNWYWVWSKYSLPFLSHPAVPAARFLSDPGELIDDLASCVLKPLFSFAGTGVRVDVQREHVEAIPVEERSQWLLQRKVDYSRSLLMPDGSGVAAEIRVMCLRPSDFAEVRPMYMLVRLSRGSMIGVDQNRDMPWTGSSAGVWTAG